MSATHLIQNFDELATTDLRRDALSILEAGLSSIETKTVVRREVTCDGRFLYIQDRSYDLDTYDNVYVVGIGKCAGDACVILEEMLGERLAGGIVLDVRGVPLKKLRSEVGTHPLPSHQNVAVAEHIADMLDRATERDLIVTVISGGGSALLCLPHDMTCEAVASITQSLMEAGATIREMNIVRKHLSKIQGGWFAQRAYPAKVVSLVFSDVPGDDLATIASGPTVRDSSTKQEAERILATYNVLNVCALPHCEVTETPKELKYFKKVENILVCTNKTALDAMREKAESLGYQASIKSTSIEGESCVLGAEILTQDIHRGECQLLGGETTVCVKNPNGKGGRNQEVALSALLSTKDDVIVVAAASDGWDNSNIAGALADMVVLQKAQQKGLDVQDYLERNMSYDFFAETGDAIKTGRLGSNVSDLYIVLAAK
jgi:glycerate 2-kinase